MTVCVCDARCVWAGRHCKCCCGLLEFGEDCVCILPIRAPFGAAMGGRRAEVAVRVDECRGDGLP